MLVKHRNTSGNHRLTTWNSNLSRSQAYSDAYYDHIIIWTIARERGKHDHFTASILFSFLDEDHAIRTFTTSLHSTLKYEKCKSCLLELLHPKWYYHSQWMNWLKHLHSSNFTSLLCEIIIITILLCVHVYVCMDTYSKLHPNVSWIQAWSDF